MIAPNDIDGRGQEIELLVAADNVIQATRRLMDFVRDFSQNPEHRQEVIVISNSYTGLDRRERQGVMPYADAERERRKLLYEILGLIEAIKNDLALNLALAG